MLTKDIRAISPVLLGIAALALFAVLMLLAALAGNELDELEEQANTAATSTAPRDAARYTERYAGFLEEDAFPEAWQVYEHATLTIRFMYPSALRVVASSSKDGLRGTLQLVTNDAASDQAPLAEISVEPFGPAAQRLGLAPSTTLAAYRNARADMLGTPARMRGLEDLAGIRYYTFAWRNDMAQATTTWYGRLLADGRLAHMTAPHQALADREWWAVVRSSLIAPQASYPRATWKTYQNEAQGFAFDYPPHWQAFVVAPEHCTGAADSCPRDVLLTPDPQQPLYTDTQVGRARTSYLRLSFGVSFNDPAAPDTAPVTTLAEFAEVYGGTLGSIGGRTVVRHNAPEHPRHQDLIFEQENGRFIVLRGLDTPLFDTIFGSVRAFSDAS